MHSWLQMWCRGLQVFACRQSEEGVVHTCQVQQWPTVSAGSLDQACPVQVCVQQSLWGWQSQCRLPPGSSTDDKGHAVWASVGRTPDCWQVLVAL